MGQWRLANTQLHCYMNTCTWAHMWFITYLPEPIKSWGLLRDINQAADVDPYTPIRVAQSPGIRPAIKHWYEVHNAGMQQDCPEFCIQVLFQCSGFQWGSDSARREKMEPVHHSLRSPIILHFPEGKTCSQSQTLQAMITNWHEEQLCMHALKEPTSMFCMQVERSKGRGEKDGTAVELGAFLLHMPVFTQQDLRVSWQPYVIKAFALHRGDATSQAHYQAVLVDKKTCGLLMTTASP